MSQYDDVTGDGLGQTGNDREADRLAEDRRDTVDHGAHLFFDGEAPVARAFPQHAEVRREGDGVVDVVRVVGQATDDYIGQTVNAFPVGTAVAQLLAEDSGRVSATVVNNGTDPVRIGKRSQLANGIGGFLLPAGAALDDINTRRAVYVITASPATTVNPVSVWAERNED